MNREIDGEPRQEDYANGMSRKPLLNALGRLLMSDGPRRQTVVTADEEFLRDNIGLSALRLLVIPCLTFQKAVQIFFAAIEIVEQMLAAQFLDRAELAHSRTLGVFSSFSRRGRAAGGLSSAATKASYCLALRGNSWRSARVSAAASKPLSRIKALTVLRSTDAARLSIDFALSVRRTSSRSSLRFIELGIAVALWFLRIQYITRTTYGQYRAGETTRRRFSVRPPATASRNRRVSSEAACVRLSRRVDDPVR